MDLTWRPIEAGDVEACSRLPLMDEEAYDADTRALLPKLWRELVTTGYAETAFVEDRAQPPGRRLVAFAIIPFLADEFVAEITQRPPPYVNRVILERWRAGKSPILGPAAVRAANSRQGLNQHTMHESLAGTAIHARSQLMEYVIGVFFEMSRGYKLREATIEVYGETQLQWNLNGGFRVRGGECAIETDELAYPADKRPYLIGMTREESGPAVGSAVGAIFNYVPPRFFLKPAEQETLQCALAGSSDTEIAQRLCVSLPTIHKRWQTIFTRVQDVYPDLLPDAPLDGQAGRGIEKRRPLLNYLRAHPEELRPNLPSK